MSTPTVDAKKLTLVLIDDNQDHLELLKMALTEQVGSASSPPQIESFTDPSRALTDLPVHGDVVILCDYRLHGSTGLEWLRDFIRADVGPVIIMTGTGNEAIAREAFRAGAADYLLKREMFDQPQRLALAIRESLRRYDVDRRNRELARQLKLANAELERKNTVLAELMATAHGFVDDVAHEFRTPLAVIKEFASIMADGLGGEITVEQAEYLRFIIDGSRDLAMLVEDFLDSGKLRAKTLRVDRRCHTVAALFDAVRPMLHMRASTKNIVVEEEIDEETGGVLADIEKVGRVIVNLVVNAIKFSPEGSTVLLWARSREGGAEIGVTDQGPGLSPPQVEQIFERFRQVGEMQRGGVKGFGLGLNIARELVWLNLGTMRVESEPGEGSTFAFTLPTHDATAAFGSYVERILESNASAALSALRITLRHPADDLDGLRDFLTAICHPMDFILPADEGRSLTVVGTTVEPANWAARLQQARVDRAALDPEDTIGPIEVVAIGTWPAGHARAPILDSLEATGSERRKSA